MPLRSLFSSRWVFSSWLRLRLCLMKSWYCSPPFFSQGSVFADRRTGTTGTPCQPRETLSHLLRGTYQWRLYRLHEWPMYRQKRTPCSSTMHRHKSVLENGGVPDIIQRALSGRLLSLKKWIDDGESLGRFSPRACCRCFARPSRNYQSHHHHGASM